MATTMQLGELRTEILRRCNMENSPLFTVPELNSYINQSSFELYDLLVQEYGDDYFVASPYSFTTDGSAMFYPLPADFFKLLGVDVSVNPNSQQYITIKRFNFSDRNRFTTVNSQTPFGPLNTRYRVNGDQIWLNPLPQAGLGIRLWYIPRMKTLQVDTDTLEGISGWTEYVIVDCCIKCLAKEESDTSVFMNQKMALIKRIVEAAENRDAGSPATVGDSRGEDDL